MYRLLFILIVLLFGQSLFAGSLVAEQVAKPSSLENSLPTIHNNHEHALEHGDSKGTEDIPQEHLYHSRPKTEAPLKAMTVKHWVESGVEKAKGIIIEAQQKSVDPSFKNAYNAAIQKLTTMNFHWPKQGYEYNNCSSQTLAYTYVHANDIYVCRRVIDDSNIQIPHLAQILVHELAHTVGFADECQATYFEVNAMRLTIGLQFKNGYFERCFN